MTTLTYTAEVRGALAPVRLTPEALVEVLGSCLAEPEVYLVGSLAAGLGNADSDVDLHVFVDEAASGTVPMLFFADRTRLDIVNHHVGSPAAAIARTPTAAVDLLGGRCALGPGPDMTDLKRLSRWATAVPMHEGSPALFDGGERVRAAAAVVRGSVDAAVRTAAVATLVEAAGDPLRGLLWSRAADAAVEVAVRAAGEIFVGDKWLPKKAQRARLPAALLQRAASVDDASGHAELIAELGLPIADPASLVVLTEISGPTFRFGSRRLRLAGDRLIGLTELASSRLAGAMGAHAPAELLSAIVAGAVTVAVDHEAVDGRLR